MLLPCTTAERLNDRMNTRKAQPNRALRGVLSATVLLGALAVPLLAATPANAEELSQSCWTNVDTGETGCFDSSLDIVEQIELATGVPLVATKTDSPNAPLAARASKLADPPLNFLLMTGWDGTNQSGPSVSFFTSAVGVCSGITYSLQSLNEWNDRIESFQAFNGCDAILYEDEFWGGDSFGPAASSNNLGTFNNKASALDLE
ncbi:hypothetical protein [Compostimonas suwonensis]|uniref:Peptidase inhibitor family I36 n=1 Tax=Compostimonas suwonensis TaxID=1048394 RepID=A0A2M9C051_9MICO|nr:hypothetical protein [Compostimonas suwonensis]PJJ63721.1 hypothetical protein CLV54_1394 [Compostimonas suwonensis]